ncbi:tetratricopeptide repeat protein [Roseibium sp.]|uniref:tetratricopeptide repeat-containing glycosyltransferase family protein n=1 Tax=Roseibium sp. TaxID=1936156 RepID=UPI003B51CDB5
MPLASVISSADKALQLEPGNPAARSVKSLALIRAGRYSEAEEILVRLVKEVPEEVNFLRNLGAAVFFQRRYPDALQFLEKAVHLDPENLDNAIRYAQCRVLNDETEHAEDFFRPIMQKHPENGDVLHEYARILLHLSRYKDALPYAEVALSDKPSDVTRQLTISSVLLKLGRVTEAHDILVRLDRQCRGQSASVQLNLATAKFALGDLENAWSCYKARFDAEGSLVERRIYNAPEWDGSAVDRLLVWADQGLGDILQCAAILPELSDCVGRIILEVEERFVPYFQAALPDIHCRPYSVKAGDKPKTTSNTDYDCVYCLSDIPGLLRPNIGSFSTERRRVYQIDRELVRSYRSRIPEADRKSVVGLSWRSRLLGARRARFYLTAEQVLPVLETKEVVFVNLQYGATQSELDLLGEAAPNRFHFLKDLDLFNDISGAAALTAACDIVVSPNSSVADMAGVLGVPTLRFGGPTPKLQLGQKRPPWFPHVNFLQMDAANPAADIVPRIKTALEEELKHTSADRYLERLHA